MKNHKSYGNFLVLLGAIFWSLNAPLVKYIAIDPFLKCGLRALIAGVAMAFFIRPKKLRWNRWMLVYLVSYCGLSLFIILALSRTDSAIAIGMQYTAIIWLFLLNWIATKTFDKIDLIPILVILMGVVFFMCSGGKNDPVGNLLALCEGVFFAGMTLGSKKAAGENVLGLTALGNLFTGVLVLSLFPASTATVVSMNTLEWIVMLVLGVVQIGCGYAFYNLGIQRTTPQKASVIALWEMILGPVWVALFLGEYPNGMVLAGFGIILVGMLLDAKKDTLLAKRIKS